MNKSYSYDKNYYDELDEFIHEFTCTDDECGPCTWGMEFKYRNKFYRLCRQHIESQAETPNLLKKFNKKIGNYQLVEKKEQFSNGDSCHYEYIGIYDDVYDLLENAFIEGVNIKDLLLDKDNLIIYGKD